MVTSRALYLGLLALVGAERIFELALSRRNAARAFARGGRELGRGHFPAVALQQAAWLASCAIESGDRSFPGAVGWAALAAVGAAQALRYWAVASLGDRWNVRIVVVPGEEPVQRGPYRRLRHPNYTAVALEMAALPLVYGCWITALVFSATNALVLRVRIAAEEAALGPAWARAFAARPRFLPGGRGGHV
jgi:methyltransferase